MSTDSPSLDPSLTAIQQGLRRPVWPILISITLIIIAVVLWVRGSGFYELPISVRPEHEDYIDLRPSGMLGQGYGFVGTGLILTNLLYLVRRKLASWPLGSLRVWLEVHVFTGLAGSLIILYHSAFQLRSPLATTTAVSLVLVVVTGMFGRYLVGLAPKRETAALATSLKALDELLPGLGSKVETGLLGAPVTRFRTSKSFLATMFTIPKWMGESRARKRVVAQTVAAGTESMTLDAPDLKLIKHIRKETQKLAAQEVRSEAAVSVLRVWRRLHRFFAILMLLSVGVHIGVAWYYGYRWIWSE